MALIVCVGLVATSGCSTTGSMAGADESEGSLPQDAVRRYESALEQMLAREDDAAVAAFESLSADYPGFAGPLVNLGILYRRGGEVEEARRHLDAAITLCADCAAAYNELGILERQLGAFEAAEAAYLKAIAVDPEYPLAYLNLGVLYDLYQRRLDLALDHYESYVELSSDSQSNEEVEKWIADLRRRVLAVNRTAMVVPVR